MKQYKNIQGLRAIAVLLVVFAHLHDFSDRFHVRSPIVNALEPLPAWGVDLFFVISGFVMAVVHWQDFGAPQSPQRFLLRRIVRIYPLYWIVTFVLLLALRITPGLTHTWMGASANVPLSLTLFPQQSGELLFVAWTLTYEMYFYCMFAALLFFSRSFAWRTFALWGAIIVGMQFVPAVQQNLYGAVVFGNLVLEFIMGAFIGAAVVQQRFISPLKPLAFGGLALTVTFFVVHNTPHYEEGNFRFLWVGVPMAAFVYAAAVLEVRQRLIFPRFLQSIGDGSYSIYLWHTILFSILGKLIVSSHVAARIPTSILLTVAPLLVVASSMVLYYRLEVPLTKACRALIRPALRSKPVAPSLANTVT